MIGEALEAHSTLGDLAREIAGSIVIGDPTTVVCDVRHDAREVQPGDVFVACKGQRVDGAVYVPDALARGAVAVIAESPLAIAVPQLVVPDARRALAFASSAVWCHPSFSMEVIGVTGTNGKTTTTWLIEHILQRLGRSIGILGTVEHRLGAHRWAAAHTTPESDDLTRRLAAMRALGATEIAMEVSSHALALQRVESVRFRVAAFTNLTQDHLDFHSSMEDYAQSKRRLFTTLGPAMSVLNIDDPTGAAWAREGVAGQLLTTSARGDRAADFYAINADFSASGITATIASPAGELALRSPLVGRHNLENLLTALASVAELGVSLSEAAATLTDAIGAPGRLEPVRTKDPGFPAVFVDYAHTPDALANVLQALRKVTRGRLFCVFGCGGDRDARKRAPMGLAVAEGADIAVLTTDNPRSETPTDIANDAVVGLKNGQMRAVTTQELSVASRGSYCVVLDRREAIAVAIESAGKDDVVLIAGKGHETYQEVLGVRHAFDDRVEAAAVLSRREPL
ncbi:MAG: UDP-N-acetylmuramoyl-L-alanyl-D-glutamate--2,6-diaminopimelate ligase [Deltaproteobacteria bacterium]|nr:UDP-N-acetylmuramoyl-L-alanyl-D-glutamate--2,6-diaminopimelate ligase [Deltaproteobacteria bacterium]